MSWKSLVTASLLCVLASPAFADPSLALVKGGTAASGNLDSSGNWVWAAQVTPDFGLVTGGAAAGTPIGIEAGFTSSSTGTVAGQGNLLIAARVAANFDTPNPGTAIFGWQTGGL